MGCGSSAQYYSHRPKCLLSSPSLSLSPQEYVPLFPRPSLRREDFETFLYYQTGGIGKVCFTKRKSDQKKFAVKFFGYTKESVSVDQITREIAMMEALKGVPNVNQFEGFFMDSAEGYIPNRISRTPFPVIVMEALEGGDLYGKISEQGASVTENYFAIAFRGIIEALHEIHRRGYIHRDLKLENLMYVSAGLDSPIKIIDFGLMVNVSTAKCSTTDRMKLGGIYISQKIEGTPRYCAPETWVYKQYSCQSDVWQAGCCLYSMLSGYSAFGDNPRCIVEGLYSPMDGEGWDNISEIAKDLIRKMLVVDPANRCTTQQILSHEWLHGSAPENKLDMNYVRRIKKLEIATQLKHVFLDKDIQKNCELKRQYLLNKLPFLFCKQSFQTSSDYLSPPSLLSHLNGRYLSSVSEELLKPIVTEKTIELGTPNDSVSSSFEEDVYFYQKLKLLRVGIFYAMTPSPQAIPSSVKRYPTSEDTEFHDTRKRYLQGKKEDEKVRGNDIKWKVTTKSKTDSNVLSTTGRARSQSRAINGSGMNWDGIDLSHITYENFVLLLKKVDLPQLATREIFDIFDHEQIGVVNMKEFLLTILAFYSPTEKEESNRTENDSNIPDPNDNTEAVRLFFNFFDVKETGCIDLAELKLVIGCLLADDIHTSPDESMKNVEELFHTMDLAGNGVISFDDFQTFYNAVLRSAMDSSSSN